MNGPQTPLLCRIFTFRDAAESKRQAESPGPLVDVEVDLAATPDNHPVDDGGGMAPARRPKRLKDRQKKLGTASRRPLVTVYRNDGGPVGEGGADGVPVFSLSQIFKLSGARLKLSKDVQRVFKIEGLSGHKEIYNIDELVHGDSLVVSCGEAFVPRRKNRRASGSAKREKSRRSSRSEVATPPQEGLPSKSVQQTPGNRPEWNNGSAAADESDWGTPPRASGDEPQPEKKRSSAGDPSPLKVFMKQQRAAKAKSRAMVRSEGPDPYAANADPNNFTYATAPNGEIVLVPKQSAKPPAPCSETPPHGIHWLQDPEKLA